jgi:hypothetical protein
MPPNSVSTLVAGKYRASVITQTTPRSTAARAPASSAVVRQLYSLDGRLVGTSKMSARSASGLANGVYCASEATNAARRAMVVTQ